MEAKSDAKLSGLLNASGFVFQLAVEDAIRKTTFEYGWKISATEYPWSSGEDSGFIDLVVSSGNVHLLLECKRTRDADWLFLMTDNEQQSRSHARICWTNVATDRRALTGWGDTQIYPASPEPTFCAIRGQGERDKPLLERLAGEVVASTEGLASDFLQLGGSGYDTHIMVPVIVTTASLHIGLFNPADASLVTGEVDNATFTSAPSVRFRKSLAPTEVPDEFAPDQLKQLSYSSERTVFVVEGQHLIDWLKAFQIKADWPSSPWRLARQKADAMG